MRKKFFLGSCFSISFFVSLEKPFKKSWLPQKKRAFNGIVYASVIVQPDSLYQGLLRLLGGIWIINLLEEGDSKKTERLMFQGFVNNTPK